MTEHEILERLVEIFQPHPYDTSLSIAKHGWEKDLAQVVRLARTLLASPSAPLIPLSRADAMVAEEREEIAREFERAAEAIEANARDPNRPNIGCTVQECLEAAQRERNVAAAIRAHKTGSTK